MLSFEAVQDWLRLAGCPESLRLRAWTGVQLLHDAHRHSARFSRLHPDLCWHSDAPLRLVDTRRDRVLGDRRLPNCPTCARRWRCETCDRDFVFHDHG